MKRTVVALTILLLGFVLLSGQVFAQAGPRAHVAVAYHQTDNRYAIVVKGTAGDRLDLYVNDKHPPAKATVNNRGWATFHWVKLVGTGKVSFTRVITSQNKSTYQRRINFHEQFAVSNGKAKFVYPHVVKPRVATKPVVATVPAIPAPARVPASTEPTCTNGSYINTDGITVCSPETSSTVPAGATAKCVDGTYSFSLHHSGTCSHHGGVAEWL